MAARVAFALFLAIAALAAGLALARVANRNALWHIAHDKCVPDEEAHHDPAPCARVDLSRGVARGYVILKDIRGRTQFLLIPTKRISGIESPALLAPDAPNYWAAAWQNRSFVMARAGHDLGFDAIGLAINSSLARSQDQLHIHIDCLMPDVKASLAAHIDMIGTRWAELPFALAGHIYFARRIAAGEFARQNPFKLLARGLQGARAHMGQESLALAGADFGPGEHGFVLLATRADPTAGEGAHAEELLDHDCALAQMK